VRKLGIAFLAGLVACSPSSTNAQDARPLRPDAPRLIVAISVDQWSADLFDEYRPHFTGGLKRLAAGTAYRNGYQSHAATETCPGHSTLLTGKRPATNGIVANTWLDQNAPRTDKTIYCWGLEEDYLGIPTGSFKAVSAGVEHNCAILEDDTAECLGNEDDGRADAPEWTYLAISAGGSHSCGLQADYSVECWGLNDKGQADPPPP
jgi:hypothetical protein